MTITDSLISGNNVDPNGSPGGEFGGGISVRYGTRLDVQRTEISNNKASISGGGLYSSDRFTAAAPNLTIQDSTLRGNSSADLGGGITMAGGRLELDDTVVDQNTADARGGGLFLTGLGSPTALDVEVRSSTISGNNADLEGGGVAAGPNMMLTMDASQVVSNHTRGKGGGLYLTSLGVALTPHVSSITNTTISDNVARYIAVQATYASGAGLWAGPAADVTIASSSLSNNRAGRLGGGLMAVRTANFELRDSTVDANVASIHGGGAYVADSDALFEQDTWSANEAADHGGAMLLVSTNANNVRIQHNTFSLNQADSDQNGTGVGGGIYVDDQPLNVVQTRIANSIIANNFAGSILALPHNDDLHDGPGLAGLPPVASDYNLIGSRKGTLLAAAQPDPNGNYVGTALMPIDPMLGALANNGGTTLTMLPQTGSPAIDVGDPAFVGPPALDQRGASYARVVNGRLDMGAVEVQSALPSPDFDFDGDADCDDINALTHAIANGTYMTGFDMNGDGVLDIVDIERWLCKAGSWNLGPNLSYRFGDANLDGAVDGQDFIQWNGYKFTANSDWCAGDFNADGMIDGQDFITWNANKFLGPIPCIPVPVVAGGKGPSEPMVPSACTSSPLAPHQGAQQTAHANHTSPDVSTPQLGLAFPGSQQFLDAALSRDDDWGSAPQQSILDSIFAGLE